MARKSTSKSSKSKTTTTRKKKSSYGSRSQNNNSIDSMKYEIAREFGVTLGPNSSAKANGKVGGEITKRLVEKAMNKKGGNSSNY